MITKNVKVGDTVLVKATVEGVKEDKFYVSHGCLTHWQDANEVYPLPSPYQPLNLPIMTEVPQTYPKYDPCRKFREGDKVRVKREVHGRPVYIGEDAWEPLDPNEIWEVVEEKETGWVYLKNGCLEADVWHGMLELVTPVEELEPYIVTYDDKFYHIHKQGEEASIAVYSEARHPHAKESAEAECDRLNAEYRKEQSND